MKVLVVDNYDSFTYNLVQQIVGLGAEVRVVRNDELSVDEVFALAADRIVLSPGPGSPMEPADIGICRALIRRVVERGGPPLLGVCLGHQAIGVELGGQVVRTTPVHGRASWIEHIGHTLFAGLPKTFSAVRYHSLALDRGTLPCELSVIAESDGMVMAMAHARLPLIGVQFHPESIETEHGDRLMANFLGAFDASTVDCRPSTRTSLEVAPAIRTRTLPWADPERVFSALFRDASYAYWLDSGEGRGRYSYMGEGGPERVFSTGRRITRVRAGDQTTSEGDPFEALGRLLGAPFPSALPFPFAGGYVGYFGYELGEFAGGPIGPRRVDALPDMHWMRADRLFAFDHAARRVTLVTLDGTDAGWLDRMERCLGDLPPLLPPRPLGGPVRLRAARSRDEYLRSVAALLEKIRAGETYEVCLTMQVHLAVPDTLDPLALYRMLRRHSPAPYGAYVRLGDAAILSASPERFVHMTPDGVVESRPIKGTRRRGVDPGEDRALRQALAVSAKDRAENLMIVDLVRNDLGRVCRAGSVAVPERMVVEEHPTVFQLVSTVRGQLADGVPPLECVRALFPGGSMTGAPKIRSMKIAATLEGEPRGIYAGCLGFLGASGEIDLAMAIRTLVARPGELSFGIGGAVVAQSDPEEEYAEAWAKASALLRAVEDLADPIAQRPQLGRRSF